MSDDGGDGYYFMGKDSERERCVAIIKEWRRADSLRLHAGELTAQEVRTVQAILNGVIAEIERED